MNHHNTAPGSARSGRCKWTQAMLILVGIALFLGFISLGSWQVQRRAWKLALIERVDQRVHAAPVAAPAPAQWPQIAAATYEYLPVQLQGQWLADKTVLTQATTELGAGFWVLTPLQTSDGSQVLVNRGFVPGNQRQQWLAVPAPAAEPPAAVQITGLLRMSEPGGGFLRQNDPGAQRWFSRDVQAIAQAQGLSQAAPYFVDAGLPRTGPASWAAADASSMQWPQPGMTVIRFSNSHLVYALTWYAMALMVLLAAWLVRRHTAAKH